MKRSFAFAALAGFFSSFGMLPASAADTEQQIGRQVYGELLRRNEIIANSPLYSVLTPIAERIKSVADPQYQYPFHFILVHEKDPNAFAVPGGNVYVTDSLMRFADNKEELAGVLCHETSHTIHHDVVNLMHKDQNVQIIGVLAQIFLARGNYLANSGIGLLANLQQQHFSRSVETAADLKGSETCAQANYNPYGMVWLFQKFQKSGKGGSMEMLSDHPRDDHRVADLQDHFRSDPALFGRFLPDVAKATPLKLPAESTRPQARPGPPGAYGRPPAPAPSPAATATPS